MRIFLQRVDFSRNVESSETGWADLSIQWQLHPGWKTTARPPPPQKSQTLSGKNGKRFTRESWAPRKCRDDWLHHNRKAHGRHRSQQITSIFSCLLFNTFFLSCQSKSSGLFSITTKEACCPFFILTATEDKRSQRKELNEAFQTNVGCIEGFLLYTLSNALEQLAKQFFNN